MLDMVIVPRSHVSTIAMGGLITLTLGLTGCGGDEKPTMAEALAQADQKEAERKANENAQKEALAAKAKEEDPNAYPWTVDELKGRLKMGTVLTYAVSGTDAKGKSIDDEQRIVIKGGDDASIKVASDRKSDEGKPTYGQAKTIEWSKFSPTFYVERPTEKMVGAETVEVPAGSYETTKAEVEGFFGERYTVWMIRDEPGVYAKVIDHGNANEPDAKTEIVYELASIGTVE